MNFRDCLFLMCVELFCSSTLGLLDVTDCLLMQTVKLLLCVSLQLAGYVIKKSSTYLGAITYVTPYFLYGCFFDFINFSMNGCFSLSLLFFELLFRKSNRLGLRFFGRSSRNFLTM